MRIEQLTITRFAVALSVVVFHFGKSVAPFSHEAINYLVLQANVGVSYFFILSGLVMIAAYGQKDRLQAGRYLQKRFARLYPVHLFAILLLLSFKLTFNGKIDYSGLFLNVALLQSWIPGYALSFNYPAWSLSTEFFFYASFPFLFNHFYKKYSLRHITIGVLVVFVCSQLLFHGLFHTAYDGKSIPFHDFIYYFPLMHLNEFLLGNLAGLFLLRHQSRKGNYDLPILGLLLMVIVLLKFNFGLVYHNGLLAFFFVPLIVLIALNEGLLARISKSRICIFLGDISYGIYILQVPVFKWGNVLWPSRIAALKGQPELLFFLNLFVLIVLSALSYTYFEKPLRNIISNWRRNGEQTTENKSRESTPLRNELSK